MSVAQEPLIRERLAQISAPFLDSDLLSAGMVRGVGVDGEKAALSRL